jgi:signal transduction histidine kinase
MSALIDGVLSYSEVGHVNMKVEKVDIYEVVKKVTAEVASPENIVIAVENQLPVVDCEETRIIQVFQNLLNNAVRYMDKPKGQIKVCCVEEDGFCEFSVADNSPGIEERNFERIFQIFWTFSPGYEMKGTGVGLSVVKKNVQMYDGRIWVESELNNGSTFFFTFPRSHTVVKNDTQLLTSSS